MPESKFLKFVDFLRCPVVHLGACVEWDRRQSQPEEGLILRDESIHSSVVEVPCKESGLLKFFGAE